RTPRGVKPFGPVILRLPFICAYDGAAFGHSGPPAMAQPDRQRQILTLTRQRGFVSIDELAGHFGVTPQTVRRDINDLCARDLLRRYHGGAGLPSSVENLAYQARRVLNHAEKRRIARLLAQHVPDEASLFINIGTTTEEVARALLKHRGL